MNQIASLSESARTIALERFLILQPHLEQERFLTKVAVTRGSRLIGLPRDEREDSGSRRALF